MNAELMWVSARVPQNASIKTARATARGQSKWIMKNASPQTDFESLFVAGVVMLATWRGFAVLNALLDGGQSGLPDCRRFGRGFGHGRDIPGGLAHSRTRRDDATSGAENLSLLFCVLLFWRILSDHLMIIACWLNIFRNISQAQHTIHILTLIHSTADWEESRKCCKVYH